MLPNLGGLSLNPKPTQPIDGTLEDAMTGEDCAICFDPLNADSTTYPWDGPGYFLRQACTNDPGHFFHAGCLRNIVRMNRTAVCPECRAPLLNTVRALIPPAPALPEPQAPPPSRQASETIPDPPDPPPAPRIQRARRVRPRTDDDEDSMPPLRGRDDNMEAMVPMNEEDISPLNQETPLSRALAAAYRLVNDTTIPVAVSSNLLAQPLKGWLTSTILQRAAWGSPEQMTALLERATVFLSGVYRSLTANIIREQPGEANAIMVPFAREGPQLGPMRTGVVANMEYRIKRSSFITLWLNTCRSFGFFTNGNRPPWYDGPDYDAMAINISGYASDPEDDDKQDSVYPGAIQSLINQYATLVEKHGAEEAAANAYSSLSYLWRLKWEGGAQIPDEVLQETVEGLGTSFAAVTRDHWRAFLTNAIQQTSNLWRDFESEAADISLGSTARTDASIGAPRGGRMPFETQKFFDDRRYRLTGSLLPFWMGLPGTYGTLSRKKILAIINARDGFFRLPTPTNQVSAAVQKRLLEWGRNNELRALQMYMEMTRTLVSLGSTRIRQQLPGEDKVDDAPLGTNWYWHDVIGATPDGFCYDVDHQTKQRGGKALLGLLELKCPAYEGVNPAGVMRKHDVEFHIKQKYLEENHYYLLQMWMQLEVTGGKDGAGYVDLVLWKRAAPYGTPAAEYLYIQRLYYIEAWHDRIKNAITDSVGEFARGLDSIERDQENGERTDAQEQEWQTNRMAMRAALKQQQKEEIPLPERDEPEDLRQRDRADLRKLLEDWAHEGMCWRDTGDAPLYPWRSRKEMEQAGKPLNTLAMRYRVDNGETATLFGVAGNSGYTVLPVNAKRIYNNEVL